MWRVVLALSAHLMVFLAAAHENYDMWCMGNCEQDATPATQGGVVLMGGGKDTDEAFAWQSTHANGGDFVVIRTSGDEAYNEYIMGISLAAGHKLNSVTTILFKNRRASEETEVLSTLANAEAIFLAGGDQSVYLDYWAGSSVQKVIQSKLASNVTIGGTSAGCMVLGGNIYSADRGSITSEEALANPYHRYITFAEAPFLQIPFLATVLADTHFVTRDRMGRLFAFLARLMEEKRATELRGLGIDEHTALLLDLDTAVARTVGVGTAYLCTTSQYAQVLQKRSPLTLTDVSCQRLSASAGDTINLKSWQGSGVSYSSNVLQGSFTNLPYGPQ